MNIFVLDESPIVSALAQHDRHVVKMILESAQMLSGALQHSDTLDGLQHLMTDADREFLYKPTHMNHPCSVWVRASDRNFTWLAIHMDSLLREYHRRFPGKTHACTGLMYVFAAVCGKSLKAGFYTDGHQVSQMQLGWASGHTPFVFAGPDRFRADDVVESYRAYYRAEKVTGNRWTRPIHKPEWLADVMTIHTPVADSKAKLLRVPRQPKPLERIPPVSASALRTPAFLRKPSN